MFYQDLFNCFVSWARSRRWRRMLLLATIPALLFIVALGLVIYGSLLTRQQLASRYLTLVQADVDASLRDLQRSPQASANKGAPAANTSTDSPPADGIPADSTETDGSPTDSTVTDSTATDSTVTDGGPTDSTQVDSTATDDPAADRAQADSTAPEDSSAAPAEGHEDGKVASETTALTSQRLLVPLRRIMQLGNSNERVTYLVGAAMAQQGRWAMAARMLRDIAPVGGGGFPPAHAFMARYSARRQIKSEAEAEELLADYATAERGGAKLEMGQLVNYAGVLVALDRKQEAVRMLRDHVVEYPELNGLIVRIVGNEGSDGRTALAAGRADFENKRKSGRVTFLDIRTVVELEFFDGQIDRGLELAAYGFKLEPENLEARRLYSSALLAKHQAVTEQRRVEINRAAALGTEPPAIDLTYLDEAVRIDSANPRASEELAKAMVMGQNLSPEMKKSLEDSLIDGTATGITHLILANRKLTEKDPHTALPQLRLALKKMPNSPIVMNNLAFAIMKYEPEKLPEARALIERALQIPGVSQADQASMLDTLAEIRLAQKDALGAIEMFEQAIRFDGSKLNTRRKLAEVYAQQGMQELARGQLQKVKELSGE